MYEPDPRNASRELFGKGLFDHLIGTHARGRWPSAFAVLRLISNSYLVGACTGNSPGFSPLRTYEAERRTISSVSGRYEINPPSLTKY
jgi:hypothetical protein